MLINWFTVAAQIVNFLILVWLLKRFLYARIIRAIQARENKIAAQVAGAESAQKEAAEQLALYQSKLKDLAEQQAKLLAQAVRDSEQKHAELIEKAREHARALETRWREDVEREQSAFLADLRRRAAAEILTVARRAIADLASMDVQECTVRVFLEKVRGMDGEAWKALAGGELAVRSAFDLSAHTQAEIRRAVEEKLPGPASLRFELDPAMGMGVEVRGNGRRIGWNFDNYLQAMEEDLRTAFEQNPAAAGRRG